MANTPVIRKNHLNRDDLATLVYAKGGLTRKQARLAVDEVFDVLFEAMERNQKIVVSSFGTFEVRPLKARERHNPATGGKIFCPATVTPVFRAGKRLNDAVKNSVS